jgi:hypothetical protein
VSKFAVKGKKMKLSLSMPCRHIGGVEGIRCSSVVNFTPQQLYLPGKKPWYPLTGGWVGLRAVLNILEMR